jgi:hypothetical protein
MLACFGLAITDDPAERLRRFLEEALELVQSLGMTKESVLKMVDYVYDRPAGDPPQEVGGVSVTLMALCETNNINVVEASETELERIWTKIPQIQTKQAQKPVL